MILLATMLTKMEIITLILHVTNSIVMLELSILMLNWNKGIFLKESNTLEMDRSRIIQNMKGNFLIISKSCYVLVVVDFFPSSDDGLGKSMLNLLI
jgi:hypothetical protein